MEIERIDLGICRAYEYAGDPGRTAVVLPGAMLGGTPANSFLISTLVLLLLVGGSTALNGALSRKQTYRVAVTLSLIHI